MTSSPALPLDAPVAFTPRQLAEVAEREVRYRKRVYPRLVEQGKMSQAKMDYEIAAMEAIVERLRAIQAYAERREG